MKTPDSFYTSVTDCRWFTGNPNLQENSGFTWFIDNSGFRRSTSYWQKSVSEKTPVYRRENDLHLVPALTVHVPNRLDK